MHDLDQKAKAAKDKKASIGPDIDLNSFTAEPVDHSYIENLSQLPETDRNRMIQAGIDTQEKQRSGTYIQKDTAVLHSHSMQDGLEVIPIRKALRECDWIHNYYWKLASVDSDKFTAGAQLNLHDGYVIRALPGSKIVLPVQACLYLDKDNIGQYVHNLIIAEEGAELHVITGCATSPHLKRGLHVGISEFFVKKKCQTELHHDPPLG